MQYRIQEVTRYGLKQYVGALYSRSGERLGTVEAWSLPGCLSALKRLAVQISQAKAA